MSSVFGDRWLNRAIGRNRPLIWLVLMGLLAAGCATNPLDAFSSDSNQLGSSEADQTESSDTVGGENTPKPELVIPVVDELDVAAFTPTFEERPCTDTLNLADSGGVDIDCGVVQVPSNWEDGSGEIELAVVVFRSTTESANGPIMHLASDPGTHSLAILRNEMEGLIKPLLRFGDFVAYDQRGSGFTAPQLGCQEIPELFRVHEDDPSIDRDEQDRQFVKTLGECRDRLVSEGNVLEDYNSINSSHDVEAIRVALGYDKWNLFGASTGSKLALEVMRNHPSHVRSVLLDSVYPPQVDHVRDNASVITASYNKVIAACASEPECAAGGDLGQRIQALVAELDREPLRFEIEDWLTGEKDEVYADGDSLIGVVVGTLYWPANIAALPELVGQLENGRTEGFQAFLSSRRTSEGYASYGTFYSFLCHEEVSFADRGEIEASLPADPFGVEETFDYFSNAGLNALEACSAFESGMAPPSSNSAVISDIPTMMLAGSYDPWAPVSWAELAAETLPNSYLAVAENGSHIQTGKACGNAIAKAFFDAPQTSPDSSCLDEQKINLVPVGAEQVALEVFSFELDGAMTFSSVRPENWRVVSPGSEQYRDASFLDPTVFLQVSLDSENAEFYASYIEGLGISWGTPSEFSGSVGPFEASELGRTWTRRAGTGEDKKAEWFETSIGGQPVQIVLVTADDEYEANLEFVMLPALLSVDVS